MEQTFHLLLWLLVPLKETHLDSIPCTSLKTLRKTGEGLKTIFELFMADKRYVTFKPATQNEEFDWAIFRTWTEVFEKIWLMILPNLEIFLCDFKNCRQNCWVNFDRHFQKKKRKSSARWNVTKLLGKKWEKRDFLYFRFGRRWPEMLLCLCNAFDCGATRGLWCAWNDGPIRF